MIKTYLRYEIFLPPSGNRIHSQRSVLERNHNALKHNIFGTFILFHVCDERDAIRD